MKDVIRKFLAAITFLLFIIGLASIEASAHPVIVGVVTMISLAACVYLYNTDKESDL